MEESVPGLNQCILSYIIGLDSLKATNNNNNLVSSKAIEDIRLGMDGLFENKDHAMQFTQEFTALYTNGPAGGGGIRLFYLNFYFPYYSFDLSLKHHSEDMFISSETSLLLRN